MVASHYAQKVSWIKQLLSHVDSDTRECFARLLGIVSSALPLPESSGVISELTSAVGSTHKSRCEYQIFIIFCLVSFLKLSYMIIPSCSIVRFETQHGALCAIGYVTADCLSRTPTVSFFNFMYFNM